MSVKAMKFGKNHTDKYQYDGEKWVRVVCGLNAPGMYRCTAPRTYPRGTKFDYNTRLTATEELNEFQEWQDEQDAKAAYSDQ